MVSREVVSAEGETLKVHARSDRAQSETLTAPAKKADPEAEAAQRAVNALDVA